MLISVITTMYYSQAYLEEFYQRTRAALLTTGLEYEFVFVNDGSPDSSLDTALGIQQQDPERVSVIDLSRNFGHHKAIMTGLRFCRGNYVFLIDCDLEEEPELLSRYWSEMQSDQTTDVVFGIQQSRKGGLFERISGQWFYYFFSLLADIDYPHNTLTARLMKKNYVDAVCAFPEKNLEIWGLFVLSGFKQKGINVKKGFKGKSTYNLRRKIRMAIESITSFSSKPLYFIFFLGFVITSFSLLNILFILYKALTHDLSDAQGWASIMASLWFIGGLIIFVLGIIGIYMSKMFTELKNRPLTFIKTLYPAQKDHV